MARRHHRLFVTRLALTALLGASAACVPGGGGGGGADDPIMVGQEPEPDGAPEDTLEPEPETDPVPEPEPGEPVSGPQACLDADEEWAEGWKAFEDEVVDLVNAHRAEGADCRTGGRFGPTHALASDEQLRCAARLHSRDMGERGYFDHLDPDGVDPGVRIQAAEYGGLPAGENIAAGARTPSEVVEGWMNSDGHCANIMRPQFDEIGVGYAEVPGSPWRIYWTQTFGFAR